MSTLETQVNQVQVHVALSDNRINEATTEFRNQIELQFAAEKHGINEIVTQAQQEFTKIHAELGQAHANIQTLFEETKKELDYVKEQMQNKDTYNGKGKSDKCIVPLKELKPSSFEGSPEKWRQWIDEIKDYAEACHPGARAVLEKVDQRRRRRQLLGAQAGRDQPVQREGLHHRHLLAAEDLHRGGKHAQKHRDEHQGQQRHDGVAELVPALPAHASGEGGNGVRRRHGHDQPQGQDPQ